VILRLDTGILAAARKGHSRARHFGTTFTFLVQKFPRLRRAAHHLHAVLHLGGGQCSNLGASARYARARIQLFALPEGTILLGISATSGSFDSAGAEHSKACGALGCSHRRCSCRHLQCLPATRVPLHCALLGPVHGLCTALLRVAVLCVVAGALMPDRRLLSVCLQLYALIDG
jgi:hypothetical protein